MEEDDDVEDDINTSRNY